MKTTITVYNSVDNEYIRNTTEKLNEKIKQEKLYADERRRQEEIKTKKMICFQIWQMKNMMICLNNCLKKEKRKRFWEVNLNNYGTV